MVVQNKEAKTTPSLIDLLGGSGKTKNSQASNVFANLLSSLKLPASTDKNFNVLIDPKTPQTEQTQKNLDSSKGLKSTDTLKLGAKTLEDLLGNEETKLLPKELINVLSNDQVRSLINKAKEFLKESITSKAPEYNTGSKELPKTLMGLVELAEKVGVNLSEITLSTLDDSEKSLSKTLPQALATKTLIELKEPSTPDVTPPSSFESLGALLSEIKKDLKNDPQEQNISPKNEVISKLVSDTTEAKPLNPKKNANEENSTQKLQPLQSLLKSMNENTPITTENKELPKESAILHKDNTPKVSPIVDPLATLLRSSNEMEKSESKESVKNTDEPAKTLHTSKADSLEVKTKEAAQTMRHFAIDLKEAAENYKPPFTRVTMKLNPEKLGEVEVTLVQRGNNVHVNIQSNNNASVAFLAHNATELKAQLAHQGITNATMNFMSGGESQSQNPQQQQQQHNRFKAYESLQELESAQQELSALEIILPHYA